MVLYWAAIASYATLFIYDDVVHTSLQEDAVQLFSPLLLAFPAPELSRMGRELKKIHPAPHFQGGPFFLACDCWSRASVPPAGSSLWHGKYICPHPLLCSTRTWGELGVRGKRHHTQQPIFRCSRPDRFLVALAQEEPFQRDCWSTHAAKLRAPCRWCFTRWGCIAWGSRGLRTGVFPLEPSSFVLCWDIKPCYLLQSKGFNTHHDPGRVERQRPRSGRHPTSGLLPCTGVSRGCSCSKAARSRCHTPLR